MSVDGRSGGGDRILILAPTGRAAELVASVLGQAALRADVCASIEELAGKTEAGAGAVLVAEEALAPPGVWSLVEVMRRQPTWSDLPLVVLTSGGDATESSMSALRLVEPVGNVTLLERPLRTVTLLSAIDSALRARRRQYEVRDDLEERRRAEVEAANRAKDEFLAVLSHEPARRSSRSSDGSISCGTARWIRSPCSAGSTRSSATRACRRRSSKTCSTSRA